MPPRIGTGEPAPVDPSRDPRAAAALAAYDRFLDAVDASPWRYTPAAVAEAERRAAADRGASWDELVQIAPLDDAERERAALLGRYPDAESRAAIYAAAAANERRRADELRAGRSLDTWEHTDTSNSTDRAAPGRALTQSAPLGQTDERHRARADRYDRAKRDLADAIYQAADALAAADPDAPGPAILAGCPAGCERDHTHGRGMASRLAGCRDVRAFRDAGCGAVIAQPMSCDVRLCPDCERSRSAAAVRRYDELAAAMVRPLFATLTIPNVSPGLLGLGVDVILDAWARLRRGALFTGGPCRAPHQDPDERTDAADAAPPRRERCRHAPHREPASRACRSCGRRQAGHRTTGCTFSPAACRCARCIRDGRGCRRCVHAPVAGGVASVEVTYSAERDDWHPHLHFVADAPYLPWRELRDAWRAASCDATRAALARGADTGRSAGYRRPERRPRVATGRCAHLADAQGRPADRRCPAGHGWRERDAERCPYRDRTMDGPCGMAGAPLLEPARCRGASMTWVQAPRDQAGTPAGVAAVREALKYATKGLLAHDGTLAPAIRARPERLAELLLCLRNRRLVTGWGSFRGVTDDPDDADRPELVVLNLGDQPWDVARVPRLCPACGLEGLWEHLGTRARAECVPGAAGRLYWRPPPSRAVN